MGRINDRLKRNAASTHSPSTAPPPATRLPTGPATPLSSRHMTFQPTSIQVTQSTTAGRGRSISEDEEESGEDETTDDAAIQHSLPASVTSASHSQRPALPARPRATRRSIGHSASSVQQPDQPAAATASSPSIVLLGSAAFDCVAQQVERTQQQQTTLQRQSAFPFIHLHSRHTQSQSTQPPTRPATAEDEQQTPGPRPLIDPSAPAAVPGTQAESSPHAPTPREAASSATPSPVVAAAASSGSGGGKSLTHLLLLCCEVLSSERTYVGRLDELIAGYVLPLKSRYASLGVAREDVDQLFSYVEVIGELHHKILEHLQRKAHAMSSSAAGQQAVDIRLLEDCVANIADCFVQFAAYLKMYVQYVNQYNASMETLKRLADNKKFSRFVATLPQPGRARQQSQQQQQQPQQAASTASPLFELQSLLILPIQRIPRYELFLVSISKQVDVSFSCHAQLSSALQLVQRLASLINESKRQAENGVKMMELKRRVEGTDGRTAAARSTQAAAERGRSDAAATQAPGVRAGDIQRRTDAAQPLVPTEGILCRRRHRRSPPLRAEGRTRCSSGTTRAPPTVGGWTAAAGRRRGWQ